MPEKTHEQLQQLFCEECRERMLRAKEVVEACGAGLTYSDCFDRLHQEFDSLVGASRAINVEKLELFYRAMASYSRFLRDRLPLKPTEQQLRLLHDAIEESLSCKGVIDHCMINGECRVAKLHDRVTQLMNAV